MTLGGSAVSPSRENEALFAGLSAGAHGATIAPMRLAGTTAPSGSTMLRLLLAAVMAIVVSFASTRAQACPMAGPTAACACPCCDLDEHDSIGRPPCCVKEASADAPLPVVDRADPLPRSVAAIPVLVELPTRSFEVVAHPSATLVVRNTGPPIWLAFQSLLL
jgi:hypothetical protein